METKAKEGLELTIDGNENQIPFIINQDKEIKQRENVWQKYAGVAFTLLSANLFALTSIALKKNSHIHVFNVGTWSSVISALTLLPFVLYAVFRQKVKIWEPIWPIWNNKITVFFLWFRAVCASGVSYLVFLSFGYIAIADTTTVMSASTITVMFFAWIFFKEKLGWVSFFVSILAVLGIAIMTKPPIFTGQDTFDSGTMIGISLALGALCFITGVILSIRCLHGVNHAVLNFTTFIYIFAQSLVLGLLFGVFKFPTKTGDVFGLFTIGVVLALANLFLVLALQIEQAGVVALVRSSEVLFTFFWQIVILGIIPGITSIFGAILVVSGVFLVTLRVWVASLPDGTTSKNRLSWLLK